MKIHRMLEELTLEDDADGNKSHCTATNGYADVQRLLHWLIN